MLFIPEVSHIRLLDGTLRRRIGPPSPSLEGERRGIRACGRRRGPRDCIKCPKRTVRNVTDIEEAKWSDLTDTQRRRVVDCLTEFEPDLSFGYVAIERNDLLDLQNHYRLYEDDLTCDWDLCVIGDCYASLVGELARNEGSRAFTFDRLFSKKMSDRVVEVMRESKPELEIRHGNSRRVVGIQTADCFAGAVREDQLAGQNWLDEFEGVVDVTESALDTVERRLSD